MKQAGLKFILPLLFSTCFISTVKAQVVGGRGDNQALPKEVKAGEISKGAYTSDVNLFSGTMNTSYDLGTVSTFSGLKYNLQLSYSSTKTLGQNPLVVNGIPYGDGWNINVPTISISVASYQKYLGNDLAFYTNPTTTGDPSFSKAQIANEGSLSWFSPVISIPGVVSDRFVFKNYDASRSESVFSANVMEHYVEARFSGSIWRVTNYNGDVYEFKSVITNYRASSALKFDDDSVKTCGSCMAANLLPREEAMTWLCDVIYNKNHALNQQIAFNYATFGVFDFFKELSGDYQPALNTTLDANCGGTGMGFPSFKASRDFMLTSVGSYSDRGDIERIELGYKTVLPPSTQKNMLLPNATGVRRLDSLYNYRVVYSNGVNGATDSATIHSNVYNASLGDTMVHTDFKHWRRYNHVMSTGSDRSGNTTPYGGDHHPDFFGSTNPYLQSNGSDSQGRYSYTNLSAANDLAFSHGFLESQKIVAGLIPGDIYEIKTAIYNSNTTGAYSGPKMCNYDINIVSGRPYVNTTGIEDLAAAGGTHISGGDFINGSRGFEVFSTFNNPVKWTSYGLASSSPSFGTTSTSNFFVMPKMPSNFKGINIQVGPANSDHDFSLDMMRSKNQVSTMGFENNAFLTYFRSRTNYGTNTITPNRDNGLNNPFRKPTHNFGVGMPWYMMGKVYSDMSDLTEGPSSGRFHFWWLDSGGSFDSGTLSYTDNTPTAADDHVLLGAVELVRYSKNPYMLTTVKKYKQNGYATANVNFQPVTVLVSQLDIAYEVKTDTLFEYAFGTTDVTTCQKNFTGKTMIGWQNFYLLKSVRQVPVNGANANASSSYVYANLPTTLFDYSKVTINPNHLNTQTGGDFCGNIRVLKKITDQLGGIMSYDYYPITDSVRTQWQVIYQDNIGHDVSSNPYNLPRKNAYKVQLTVKQKQFYNSATSTLPTKIWQYDYLDGNTYTFCTGGNANVRKARTIYSGLPSTDHYYTDGGFDVDMGFKYTTVKYPTLASGVTALPYDKYTHYSTENNGLTFGKVKSVEHYDANSLLLSRTDYTYTASMAFCHALLNDHRVASTAVNVSTYEFTDDVRSTSAANPQNTTTNLAPLIAHTTYALYSSQMTLLDIVIPSSLVCSGCYANNSYFVRLTREKNTDYDYTKPVIGHSGWTSVFTDPATPGVSYSNVAAIAPASTAANRPAGDQRLSPLSGYNSLKLGLATALAGNGTYLPLYQNQVSMSTITDYDYWDCDSLGHTKSDGFRYLLNTAASTTNTLQLTFEPSWELFRKKTYSPDHPNMYKGEEYFYYYDLKQYINPSSINNDGQYQNSDNFDGLKYSQINKVRNIPYQKRTISKSTTGNDVQASEYYWYDCKTLSDTVFPYNTVTISGPLTSCPGSYTPPQPGDQTPGTNSQYDNDGCIPITHPGLLPPSGYHVTSMGNGQYMWCPDGPSVLGRYLNVPNDLNTKLLLRRITHQVDTIDRRSGDIAFLNKYYHIMRFKEVSGGTEPSSGLPVVNYMWNAGYDTMSVYKANKHTPFGFVHEEENERGLITHYYYHPIYSTTFDDPVYNCNDGGAYDLTNQGVPGCVTVGFGRPDSLQTCYTYNKDFTVNSITDPNGMVLSYQYDNFSRMVMAFRNGDTLSVNAYSQWLNDTTKTFEQKAEQNYVESFIKLDKGSTVAEHSRAYVDPLGRKYDVQTQVTANYTSPTTYDTLMIHSGLTTYDNWDRVQRQYKPFKQTNSGSAVSFAPTFNTTVPYTEQQYEGNQRGRVLRAAKYGESISTGHTVNSTYQIIDGNQLRSELVNGFYVLYSLGSVVPTTLSGFKFLKTATLDEDGKKTTTYTNAFGQKIASKTYSSPNTQEVTGYVYDSQGNMITVINPKLQYTRYLYNLVGNMYRKISVDADTVKYMYDVSGHVVLEEDANARHGQDQALAHHYLRWYKYDAFSRMYEQDRAEYGSGAYNPLLYASPRSTDSTNAFYTYSYGSTLDYLAGWQVKRCDFERKSVDDNNIPLPSPWPHPDPGSSACYYFSLSPYDSLRNISPEKKWFYHAPVVSTDADLGTALSSYISSNAPGTANGQCYLKGRLSMVKSYTHAGAFSNLSMYNYNASGWLASEASQFNVPGGSTKLTSSIAYPAYNLRGSLKQEKVDVDFDGTTDMTYNYAYDGWNRLRTVKIKKGTASLATLADYAYDDAQGLLIKTQFYDVETSGCNPVVDTLRYTYDTRNRLTRIKSLLYMEDLRYDGNHVQQALSPFLVQNDYNYNGNINVARHRYTLGIAYNYGATASLMDSSTIYGYKYDGLNRLTAADASVMNVLSGSPSTYAPKLKYGDESYTYDAIGNMKTINRGIYYGPSVGSPGNWVQNWKYVYAGTIGWNRLSEVDSVNNATLRSYGYDYNGNQVQQTAYTKTVKTSYMRSNLPDTSFIGETLSEIYQYNTGDTRIYKQLSDNSVKTYYLSDMSGKIMAEYDMTASAWKYHIYGRDRIGTFGPHMEFAVNDHLGTERVAYTAKTLVCSPLSLSYTLDNVNDVYPYGKALRTFNSSGPSEFCYTGKERDQQAKLDYFGARKYDYEIGRWTTNDPHKEKYPFLHPYAYAANNPLLYKDPDGKDIIVYDSDGKAYKFTVGATGAGGSKYIKETFAQLNDIYSVDEKTDAGAPSPKSMMDAFLTDKHNLHITSFAQNQKLNSKLNTGNFFNMDITLDNFSETKTAYSPFLAGDGNPKDVFIRYNPFISTTMIEPQYGQHVTRNGAGILGHEVRHAWDVIKNILQMKTDGKTPDSDYRDKEQKNAVDTENKIAEKYDQLQRLSNGIGIPFLKY